MVHFFDTETSGKFFWEICPQKRQFPPAGVILLKSYFRWFGTGILSLLMVALSFISAAQTPSQPAPLAGIAHAAIRVADLDTSRAFYEKLGFEEAFFMSQNGKPTQSFIKINDRQFIELYPRRQPAEPVGFMHICFESTAIEALNSTYAARGLSPIPVRRAGAGNLLFTMQGPERQNIEYTQYMPGSKHTNDRGLHLGTHRVADQIVAMGIEMQDTAAAIAYYKEKLDFKPGHALQPGQTWLELPGLPSQQVEIVQYAPGAAFQVYFSVPDLKRTTAQLKSLNIPVQKQNKAIWIQDPDGNRIFFVKAQPNF
jgi:catechol 2,3-dioxygenase-like lactoylglutathione lyase family enzyme